MALANRQKGTTMATMTSPQRSFLHKLMLLNPDYRAPADPKRMPRLSDQAQAFLDSRTKDTASDAIDAMKEWAVSQGLWEDRKPSSKPSTPRRRRHSCCAANNCPLPGCGDYTGPGSCFYDCCG